MSSSKDNLEREFHLAYRYLPKVQRIVAQINWSHNLYFFQRCKGHIIRKLEDLNNEAVRLTATIKNNFDEVGA